MTIQEGVTLNQRQKQAVEYEGGPLLIVAGPGTGKTRVITEKIRYLISEKGVSPQSILALTFTEKAAGELLARVDEAMPLGYEEPWLMTFHSFCDRILRLSGLEVGLDPDFRILTASEQWLFVRKHLFDFDLRYFRPLGNPAKFISALLGLFSRLQDEDVGTGEFGKFVEVQSSKFNPPAGGQDANVAGVEDELAKLRETAAAYAKYQELKIRESVMDFGDLISWTVRLFRERPNVLQRYRDQFQYILVDEFQDTNYAQYQLVKLLAPSEQQPNLLVVGDDVQAIYKFRGASLSNILSFKEDYPQAETVVLNRDYRNPQSVIAAVTKLARRNEPNTLETKIGIDKQLQSAAPRQSSARDSIEVISCETAEDEADRVVAKIAELAGEGGYSWRDFAVLARANSYLDPFVSAFRRASMPYQLLGNRGLFDQPEIRELVAFLRVVADPTNGPPLFTLMSSAVFGVDGGAVADLLALARKTRRPLWEVIKEARNGNDDEGLSRLVREVESARVSILKSPPTKILYDFVIGAGFVERFLVTESLANQLKIKNLNLFFAQIKQFESEAENPRVPDFVAHLTLLTEAGENPAQAEIEDIDTVNLLTVHSAKGLEWPAVFLINLVAGRFPARRRSAALTVPEGLVKDTVLDGDAHLQEERRLFYVGCTRASARLFLTWAKDYGGKRERRPSGFIEELGLSPRAAATPRSGKEGAQLSLLGGGGEVSDDRQLPVSVSNYQPAYVSYSQLETFRQCPLKYKYRYILGIPTPPSHTLSFGQTIHRVLRDFHRADLFGKKDLAYLLSLYETHWLGEGYDSEEHRQERFAEGQSLLRDYYVKHRTQLGRPLFLEKKFTLKVAGLPLIGSIDRIDEREGGVEVIDYKTGKVKDQRAVDRDEQLTIYALAARDALGLKSKSLALYFIETNEKVVTTRTDEALDQKRVELVATITAIRESGFAPTTNFLCDYCDFRHICPAYKIKK